MRAITRNTAASGFCLLLAVVVLLGTACFSGIPDDGEVEMKYTQHEEQVFGLTFEYPEDWSLARWDLVSPVYAGGKNIYAEHCSPDLKEPLMCVTLALRIVPATEEGGTLGTVDEYVSYTILHRIIGTPDIKSDRVITVAGHQGREITISSRVLLPPWTVDPDLVTYIQTWAVFKRDGYLYDLRFTASEADYDDFLETVYEHAKQTLTFSS